MKPNLFTWFALIVMLSLSACTNEELLSDVTTNKYEVDFGDTNVAESTLSVDEALNNMNFVYRNFDKEQQKERRIRTIELLKSSNLRPATRSGSAEDLPVAYIVNFENESGYAILGADYSVPPIITLGDEGSFSTENYLEFLQKSQTRSGGEIDFNSPEEVQYAMVTNGLSSYNASADITRVINVPFPEPRDTSFVLKAWPLVKTKFTQGSPYNYFAPKKPNSNNVYVSCVAGCVPIAAAQTITSMMYHKSRWGFPNITATDGTVHEIDWLSILRSVTDTVQYTQNQYTTGSLAIAKLVRAIGGCVNASYGINATSASTSLVPNVLNQLGLQNISYDNFSEDIVYDMIINKQLPVCTRADDSNTIGDTAGHSFVLDGWLKLQYTTDIYIVDPITGEPTGKRFPKQSTFDLIHANFGWGGLSDGYYTPGAFNLYSSQHWEFSDENDINDLTPIMYDTSVRIISFDM